MTELALPRKVEETIRRLPEKVLCGLCNKHFHNLATHLTKHRNNDEIRSTTEYRQRHQVPGSQPLLSQGTHRRRALAMKTSVEVRKSMSQTGQTWQETRRQVLDELKTILFEQETIPLSIAVDLTGIRYSTLMSAINQSRLPSHFVTPVAVLEDRVVPASRPIHAVDIGDLDEFIIKRKRKLIA